MVNKMSKATTTTAADEAASLRAAQIQLLQAEPHPDKHCARARLLFFSFKFRPPPPTGWVGGSGAEPPLGQGT